MRLRDVGVGARLSVISMGVLVSALLTAGVAQGRAERADRVAPGRYIVVYRDAVEAPGAKTHRLERAHGFSARFRYDEALQGFAARLNERQLAALRSDPAVDFVAPDRFVHAARVPLAAGDSVPAGVRRIGAATASEVSGPSSVNVAVIDTGVDLSHSDLSAVSGKNCVTAGAPAQDDEGHGTHVAGTIGARNNGAGIVGVAPGTRIYSVKVLDSAGSGTWSQIICGIDWVTSTRTDADPANDVAVANMSLGGPGTPVGTCATTTDAMHRAICSSTAAGVTYVVAAGNDGWDFDYPQTPDVPAAYPQVLTVTAMGDSDGQGGGSGATPSCTAGEADDRYAAFSNFPATAAGAQHTIAGPGVCIVSAAPGGGYATMSGTSMATPHVVGLMALCLGESGRAGPCAGLAPAEAIQKLRAEADTHSRATAAYGFIGDTLRPVNGFSFGLLAHAFQPVPADTTAPTVLARSPAAAASGVSTATSVTVSFSEPMNQASAQAALTLVRTSDGATVPGTYSWSGNTLTLRPAAALAEGTSYTARLGAGAKDLAGNGLATSSWSFTTARTPLTSYPLATAIEAGSLREGTYSRLAADDNLHYAVNSIASATRTASWNARIVGVANSTSQLKVRYRARASASCASTIAIYRWSTLSWAQIDSRTLGTTETLIERTLTGALGDYVSGSTGSGEVRLRLRCTSSLSSFYLAADQLALVHYRS